MKQIYKRISALAIALVMLMACCSALGDAAETKPEVDSNVIALIGDVTVTNEEAAETYAYVLDMYSYYGYDVTDPVLLAQLKDITVQGAIAQKVYAMMEHEHGFDEFTEDELAQFRVDAQASYDEAYEMLYSSFDDGEKSEEEINAQVEAMLISYGYDIDTMVGYMKENQAYNLLYNSLTEGITVSQEDVEAEFQRMVEEDKANYADDPAMYEMATKYGEAPYYTPEGLRHIKHILILYNDEDSQKINELLALDSKPEDYDAQYTALKQAAYENIKDTVQEVLDRLAAGDTFDDLISEYNEDKGMATYPEGYLLFEGCTTYVEEFLEGGMALQQVGDYSSEPVLTSYGAHILLYASDVTPGATELTEVISDEIRDELVEDLKAQAFDEAYDAYLAQLGTIYTYPENLVSETAVDDAAVVGEDALVIEGADN